MEVESRRRGRCGAGMCWSKAEAERAGAEDAREEIMDLEDLRGGNVTPPSAAVKEAMLRRDLSSCWILLRTW